MNKKRFLDTLQQWAGQGDFTPAAITRVMRYFGDPQDQIPSAHVAGTNGKGSVSVALSSIAGASGCRVGLNISPHLVRLNERIVIDGLPVEDELIDFASEELEKACKKTGELLTYHEALTASAFIIFKEVGVDFMVIEVGLGGRLDASNVLRKPEACVITSIGLDHQDILGTTTRQIAREKAGIVKAGAKLFCGRIDDESMEPIEEASRLCNVELVKWGRDFRAHALPDGGGYRFQYESKKNLFVFEPGLPGLFQGRNMALAIAVAEGIGFSGADATAGIRSVYWPARFEKVEFSGAQVIFDCAHNADGMRALVETLENENLRELRVIFGCLETKNWHEMIDILIPCASEWNLLLPQSTRAVPTETISEFLSCSGIRANRGSDYRAMVESISSNERVLVVGSMYMVGAFRKMIISEERRLWGASQ